MILLQLAAAFAPLPVPPPERVLFEQAQVVRVSPRPTFGSGVVMVLTDFDVVTSHGRYTMSMIYFGEDQFIPPVGSVCRITFDAVGLSDDFGRRHNRVDEISCDTGRDLAWRPGGPFRIEGVRILGVTPPPLRHRRRALYDGLDIESPGRAFRRLYLRRPHGGAGPPAAGALCALSYRSDWVTGSALGTPRLGGEFVRVVDRLDCAGPEGQRGNPSAR